MRSHIRRAIQRFRQQSQQRRRAALLASLQPDRNQTPRIRVLRVPRGVPHVLAVGLIVLDAYHRQKEAEADERADARRN